ncbi:MAG: leucyl/phenylalanyl-tRNA--protein transferase [Phycisphaeraceae bacterium]|nr:leucyl/phenylalanyl-tRNA--protein transferase [Phycisphaeraceae bacterium]
MSGASHEPNPGSEGPSFAEPEGGPPGEPCTGDESGEWTTVDPAEPEGSPGELTIGILIGAYVRGAFPMGEPDSDRWSLFTVSTRAILPLDRFRAPRGARRKLARGTFTATFDRDFSAVIRGCAESRPGRESSWINEPIIAAYSQLHELGLAHSVETWRDGRIVGGIYGVAMGAAFFGESMFSRIDEGGSDASSAALSVLVDHLRCRGFRLFDCQFANEHTLRLGAIEISEEEYFEQLDRALALPDAW